MSKQSFDGNTPWPVEGLANARNGSSKSDAYSHTTAHGGLAGNQRVAQHISHFTEHLPWSPAGGTPVHEDEFTAGHRWTEAEGKVHDGVGPGNMDF